MKNVKYTVAALAIIAAASFTSTAMAQTAGTGDIMLGIYDSNNTSLASLEVDLGAYSTLTTGETFNLGTVPASTYSSDSGASLVFGIDAAASSVGAGGGLASKEIAFTAATLPTLSAGNSTELTNIDAQTNALNGNSGTAATLPSGTSSTGQTIFAYTIAFGAGSFETEINNNGGNYGFGGGSLGDLLNPLSTTPGSNTFDLYTKTGTGAGDTTANLVGSFTLTSVAGNEILTYSAISSPEPSTYVLSFLGLVALWAFKRRQSLV